MKILVTVGIFPPDIGGPATFVPEIVNHLQNEHNYEIDILQILEKFEKKKFGTSNDGEILQSGVAAHEVTEEAVQEEMKDMDWSKFPL